MKQWELNFNNCIPQKINKIHYETLEFAICYLLLEFTKIIADVVAIDRSSRSELFREKGVLKNFAKFTGKDLCQSLFG